MKILSVLLSAILTLGLSGQAEAQVTFNGNYQLTPVNNGTGALVSIPIAQSGVSVTVATGSAALPLENIAGAPGAQHLYLGDDSSTNVPLGFNFPYWGQTFNNSWMYSNGLVSFTTGGIPGAGCCSGQNLPTLTDTRYNYMIAPLWTDLIDTTGQSTWVLKTPTSATYGWYNTKEYGTNNSNSFELNINSSGGISVKYANAFVQYHTVTAGMTGDLSKGEYFQYYYGQGFNIPANNPVSWGTTGSFDICLANPLASPTCAGYAQAYHDQQCSANPLYAVDCPGYAQAYHDQQCSINPLYMSDCPGYAQAYFNQQCELNGLYDRQCPNYATAYATQQLLQQQSVVSTPTTVTNTPATTSTASTGTVQVVADPVVNNVITTPSTTSTTSVSPASPVSVVNTQPSTQTVTQQAVAQSTPTTTQTATQQEQKQEQTKTEQKVADTIEKKMEPSGGKTDTKTDMKAAVAKVQKEIAKEAQGAKTIEAQVATQGLVVGSMNYVPGFDAYKNAIVPDINALLMAKQYEKPTVDNQRIQRRLSGANESKWQDMVNSQYKIGN